MAVNKTINKRTNSHGAMRNCIEYVLRQDKTSELLTYVTGPYCHDEINYDLVYRTFLEEKKIWNKDSGRMYAHNIISWHKDEQITSEQALEFGKEFAENWFSGFQTLVAVHKDKDHIHCHLVTNSVSYEDGRKLHNTRKDLERMKQLTNQMCRERGLTVAEKGKHFDGSQIEKGEVIAWSKDKYNLFRQQVKDSFVADCANLNGFNTITTGCQIIIGDGLRGTDEVEVPVVNGEYCKTAFIGHAIMDADIFISLTHFKGHEATGFGGALKNIGMGCGSRAGKMQQHSSGKPAINEEVCRGCRRCAKECGSDAITYVNKKAVIDYDKCKGCGRCIGACSFDAVYNPNSSANELLDRKMAEYAQAVCHGRPHFHIALVQDISPNCDCHGENDAPILPDIGMFASFDPVALDQACADACLKATPIADSQLGEHLAEPGWHCHHDHFKDSNPNIEWKATLDQAEKVGLGTREYELKRIK